MVVVVVITRMLMLIMSKVLVGVVYCFLDLFQELCQFLFLKKLI